MPRKTQNGTVDILSGLRLPPVYEWVECERPEVNEGLTQDLRIRVLVNPTRVEIVSLANDVQAVFDRHQYDLEHRIEARKRAKEAGELPPPLFDADADRAMDAELGAIIAPRIIEWNVQALNRDGTEVVDVPAPGQKGGNEAFPLPDDVIPGAGVLDLLNQRQRHWILRIVQSAHLGGDTRSKLSKRPEPSESTEDAKTPSGPQTVSIPTGETPQSHPKSS